MYTSETHYLFLPNWEKSPSKTKVVYNAPTSIIHI